MFWNCIMMTNHDEGRRDIDVVFDILLSTLFPLLKGRLQVAQLLRNSLHEKHSSLVLVGHSYP